MECIYCYDVFRRVVRNTLLVKYTHIRNQNEYGEDSKDANCTQIHIRVMLPYTRLILMRYIQTVFYKNHTKSTLYVSRRLVVIALKKKYGDICTSICTIPLYSWLMCNVSIWYITAFVWHFLLGLSLTSQTFAECLFLFIFNI